VKLRRAEEGDDAGIAALIGEAFPGNPKARPDVLRWQYRSNPFGEAPSWVWDDDGRIVGHYTAYPLPYLLDGALARAGNAVDAAIAPSHQGQRLFTPLAAALYEDCAAHGLPVAICYASNPIAMQGVARAGVHWMPRLRTLVLATDDDWLRRRFHLPGALVRRAAFHLGHGDAGEVIDVGHLVDDLWRRTVERDGIRNGVDRGSAWWRWRYGDAPLGPYRFVVVRRDDRLAGAAVVLERDDFGGRFGYLLELLADDADAARALLRGTTTAGLSGLVTIAVDRGPLHRLATSAGMRTLPRRLEPKGAWWGFVDTAGRRTNLVDASWHVGWGDLDHL
jgi:hypothetical protein